MTIYSGFTHWKWWFSMVMLVYQRVSQLSWNFSQLDKSCSIPISVLGLYCVFFNNHWVSCEWGGGPLLWEVFSQIHFFQEERYPPLYTFLWENLSIYFRKAISMLKPWKCKVSHIIRWLIKPLLNNSSQTIFQGGTPWVTQILKNVIVLMVPHCAQTLFGVILFGFKRTIN